LIGILVVFNLMIGLITPSMGMCLFLADSVANLGLGALVRQVIPLFFVELIVLIIISFFLVAVIGLPRLFNL
jgi:TRAP-type C4-dicarboxylate transport system permease large subunit